MCSSSASLAPAVSLLQSKTTMLASIHTTIKKALGELPHVSPTRPWPLESRLETIQKAVDQLNLEQYVNLGFWVEGMNRQIKSIPDAPPPRAIQAWIEAFEENTANARMIAGTAEAGRAGNEEADPRDHHAQPSRSTSIPRSNTQEQAGFYSCRTGSVSFAT